jgi:ATP-binding cassette, subfamily B, bacterial PglK
MGTVKKLLDLLSSKDRRRAGHLLVMILIMALIDMIGVASIMPFIAILANPSLIETNPILANAFLISSNFGITTNAQFLFALGVCMFFLMVVSLAFKALATYEQLRFTLMCEYSIGKRLVEGYLHQPYSWFLSRHSADLGKTILSEVSNVIWSGLMPAIVLAAQGAVSIALLALLIYVDPFLAFVIGGILALAYGGISWLTGTFLSRIGIERLQANQDRYTAVSEAFGAIKEIKVGGLEYKYVNRFARPAKIYAENQASAQVVSQLPRFLLEAITFGGMILLVLVLMVRGNGIVSALPIIALYALAGYRLMPALQQIYWGVATLRFVMPALNSLHKELTNLGVSEVVQSKLDTMPLTKAVELKNIFYSYPNVASPALKGINIVIPAHSSIGLVGTTGSGKTTVIDLILGLLEAQDGALLVDDIPINASNRQLWQKTVGYVPQQIYLEDDTVAANIAFGVDAIDIDQFAVERAANIANLHDFIINDLPMGYQTKVGERGVRLSGGQRQRIGIARALYHEPKLLILDEATSALDNLTEQAVMEAVGNLGHEITIVIIAHRLSTVRNCDKIYLLEKGEIKDKGAFHELIQSSASFRAMSEN